MIDVRLFVDQEKDGAIPGCWVYIDYKFSITDFPCWVGSLLYLENAALSGDRRWGFLYVKGGKVLLMFGIGKPR